MNAELVGMGSAGAKAMAVVRGEAEIYLHTGGQYEWDSCAPAAVALAHGLHVSRVDGSPMSYNRADPYLPDLLICRQEYAGRTLAHVRRVALDSLQSPGTEASKCTGSQPSPADGLPLRDMGDKPEGRDAPINGLAITTSQPSRPNRGKA